MFEIKERAILEEMQSLELQLILMQRELAKANPDLAKAMFNANSKEVELMQAIDVNNLIKLNQCSNRTMFGLPSSELVSKLSENGMESLSLDYLTGK